MWVWLASLSLTVAALVLLPMGSTANWAYPRGPHIPTGDYECANGGRGPCYAEVYEDLDAVRGIVPDWVIFAREYQFVMVGLILGVVGFSGLYLKTRQARETRSSWRQTRRYRSWRSEFVRMNGRNPIAAEIARYLSESHIW